MLGVIPIRELRLEIVTDKTKYNLGETIHTTIYMVNDRPELVRINRYGGYEYSGYSEGDPNASTYGVHVTWAEQTPIHISPGSKYEIDKLSFKPTMKGKFIISVYIHRGRDELRGNRILIVK